VDLYLGLRDQLFDGTPAEFGLVPDEVLPDVWATLTDMGMTAGTATIVCAADGTASMYTSSGGGFIGAGLHPPIVEATRNFLASVQTHLDLVPVADAAPLPETGRVAFVVLTYDGQLRRIEAAIDELGVEGHPLFELWLNLNAVITQIRLASADFEAPRQTEHDG
jgi:hypothetical protein